MRTIYASKAGFIHGMVLQAQENAQRWEQRAQQLQQKYGKVDLAEHQRVQQKLAETEAQLAEQRSTVATQHKELEEKLKKVGASPFLFVCLHIYDRLTSVTGGISSNWLYYAGSTTGTPGKATDCEEQAALGRP